MINELAEIKIDFRLDYGQAMDVLEAARLVYNTNSEQDLLLRGVVYQIEHQANKKLKNALAQIVRRRIMKIKKFEFSQTETSELYHLVCMELLHFETVGNVSEGNENRVKELQALKRKLEESMGLDSPK